MRVDFPAPFSPTRAWIPPAVYIQIDPRTAWVPEKLLLIWTIRIGGSVRFRRAAEGTLSSL